MESPAPWHLPGPCMAVVGCQPGFEHCLPSFLSRWLGVCSGTGLRWWSRRKVRPGCLSPRAALRTASSGHRDDAHTLQHMPHCPAFPPSHCSPPAARGDGGAAIPLVEGPRGVGGPSGAWGGPCGQREGMIGRLAKRPSRCRTAPAAGSRYQRLRACVHVLLLLLSAG